MAWAITQQPDRAWHWEVFLSAYGFASGRTKAFIDAWALLAIAEAELVGTPYPNADIYRQTPRLILGDPDLPVIEDEIGKHIHPLDPDEFLDSLRMVL